MTILHVTLVIIGLAGAIEAHRKYFNSSDYAFIEYYVMFVGASMTAAFGLAGLIIRYW